MFGYIIALVMALVLVALAVVVLSRAGPRSGRRQSDEQPLQPEHPFADEPTPDRSATSSAKEVEAARRLTPPA